jgi:hypothetical protein
VAPIEPCIPTKADTLPSGGLWIHEIKHDGFRIIARKNGAQVKLYSRPPTSPSDTRTLSFSRDGRGAAAAVSVWSRRRSSGQPLWCCTRASAMAMTEGQRTAFRAILIRCRALANPRTGVT